MLCSIQLLCQYLWVAFISGYFVGILWLLLPVTQYFYKVNGIQRFLTFFVATSLFTACCSLGLCVASELLISGEMPAIYSPLHLLIVGSTLTVYNLPRLIRNPYGRPRGHQPLRLWFFLFFGAGAAMAVAALLLVSQAVVLVSVVSGLFAFAYFLPALPGNKKRLRDFGLLKIIVLTSVWTIATGILPMVNAGISSMLYPFELAQRFVFVFALCVLFDIRDIETDKGNNITTLPSKLGVERAYRLVYYSLLAFLALSVVQYICHPGLPERLVAAVVTVSVTFFVSVFVRRHPGHTAFVALTDGMMLLYAALSILPHLI